MASYNILFLGTMGQVSGQEGVELSSLSSRDSRTDNNDRLGLNEPRLHESWDSSANPLKQSQSSESLNSVSQSLSNLSDATNESIDSHNKLQKQNRGSDGGMPCYRNTGGYIRSNTGSVQFHHIPLVFTSG